MKTYPAKLLLFGEHTVNVGSQALAMPLPLFHGRWEYLPELFAEELVRRQMLLPHFATYLDSLRQSGELILPVDVVAFRQSLSRGLVFQSNIPRGYGVGSSGALVAAVFDTFRQQSIGDLLLLKRGLAQMEGFFHGTSSGTDPLICFLQKAVLLKGSAVTIVESLPLASTGESFGFFLLDTGVERKATSLIAFFLENMKDEKFRRECAEGLIPAVDGAIESYLSGHWENLFASMHQISSFQFHFLKKMIPPAFRKVWQMGLGSDFFRLKICGAGGGGFLLGIARDFESVNKALAKKMPPNQALIPLAFSFPNHI